ncbi:hypothetical protein J437_LFUL008413 [Ladona fulva]|uniref:Uncharacterized protein n=1 Tax=Ladona fulva TaxID=123851 RepID=A0A8K0NZ89_LADFU|nr:hypothetical protein J437_LFUL008413 [Ladona fulva]
MYYQFNKIILGKKEVYIKTKIQLYQSVLVPTLLHGVESIPWQDNYLCFFSGVRAFPHGKSLLSRPSRQARSHSASVGSRFPAHSQYFEASFQDT